MNNLVHAMLPEIILVAVACALFLFGISDTPGARRASAVIALGTLVGLFGWLVTSATVGLTDETNTVQIGQFALYIKLITAGVGALLVLLNWPSNRDATGGPAVEYGAEAPEFFGLMLLSLAGVFMVAGANDLVLLFLGIELASIPTYVMVSISRPLPVAQEAGVKYFFLGAMSAALLLFGFSYLYGTTGYARLDEIGTVLRAAGPAATAPGLSSWSMLGVLMVLAGLAFKIAAVPLHAYAGDVYTGAATPVTAFLAFVPKTSGFVAIVKVLYAIGGSNWAVPETIVELLWVIAVLTMTVGNVLGLLALNVKRVLAYSSVAHSGYMLVGITALVSTRDMLEQMNALSGVLFYLVAYGIMNAGAFGVLMLLPTRQTIYQHVPEIRPGMDPDSPPPATTAETYEDLAGTGRRNVALGLAMAISCFSLIGLPLTVGFFGKLYLIKPALDAELYWLVVLTMVNAAISAAYYLKIVGAMFLRPEPDTLGRPGTSTGIIARPFPVVAAVVLSAVGVLVLGTYLPATQRLADRTQRATEINPAPSGMAEATAAASTVRW